MTMDTSRGDTGAHAIIAALAATGPPAAGIPPVQADQRWQWLHTGRSELDLFVKDVRAAHRSDIDSRLAVLSCGAELHRVIVRLTAAGWPAAVTRQPHRAFPFHLATMRIAASPPAPEPSQPQPFGAPSPRQRGEPGRPVGEHELRVLSSAVKRAGGELCLLSAAQVYDLVAATISEDKSDRSRLHPPTAENAPPEQDAAFAILYGHDDRPSTWLCAGEAFGAGCLAVADLEVSILPLTDAIRNPGARQNVQRLLPGAGYPYLIMRIGSAGNPWAA